MDPFLLTHSINKHLFDIGGGFTPISIRDQMIRGFLVSDRLRRSGVIGPDAPLLVVGAGAGGATAALTAAQWEIPTTLIDRELRPFQRQFSSIRYVSPTLYDWPASHWMQGKFPWKGITFPFNWEAGEAGTTVAIWITKLFEFEQLFPLEIFLGREMESPEALRDRTPTKGLIDVEFKNRGGARVPGGPHRFGAIVACTGPGKERCFAVEGEYEGPSFWQPDTLGLGDFGVPNLTRPRILVSGGGDGALQEFIRITTRCVSAGELLSALPTSTQQRLALECSELEDQFQRSFLWKVDRFDCRTNHILHRNYKSLIKRLLEDRIQGKLIKEKLTEALRPNIGSFDFRFIHPCSHFTSCYGLNRAIVLLISEFLASSRHLEIIEPFKSVTRVLSDAHDCRSEKGRCAVEPHTVEVSLARCEQIYDRTAPPAKLSEEGPYDILVLRHGIIPSRLFGVAATGNPRQILPSYVDLDWY